MPQTPKGSFKGFGVMTLNYRIIPCVSILKRLLPIFCMLKYFTPTYRLLIYTGVFVQGYTKCKKPCQAIYYGVTLQFMARTA